MAGIDPSLTVTDAGPIIHLDELDCLDLLSDFGELLIPIEVWDEVVRHRVCLGADRIAGLGGCVVRNPGVPSPRLRALVGSLRLDRGEAAALALMELRGAPLFLCDDAAARLAAESLGFPVPGTIGVLIRSIRRGMRSREQVLDILRRLPHDSTLHVSRELLATVITRIEQESK